MLDLDQKEEKLGSGQIRIKQGPYTLKPLKYQMSHEMLMIVNLNFFSDPSSKTLESNKNEHMPSNEGYNKSKAPVCTKHTDELKNVRMNVHFLYKQRWQIIDNKCHKNEKKN